MHFDVRASSSRVAEQTLEDGSRSLSGGLGLGADGVLFGRLGAGIEHRADGVSSPLQGQLDALTTLSGNATLGSDGSQTRLSLEHGLDEALQQQLWMEHSLSGGASALSLGGEMGRSVDGVNSDINGKHNEDQTWEAAAGISSGEEEDRSSWFLEGFAGQGIDSTIERGARAGLRIRW
jgi:hypothetical protein